MFQETDECPKIGVSFEILSYMLAYGRTKNILYPVSVWEKQFLFAKPSSDDETFAE